MAKNDGNRLSTAMHKAITGNRSSVDAGLLLNELMDRWGGPGRLASDMYGEFQSAPKGSMIRQRMMEAVQRLVVQATDRDQAGVVRPENMTDEDLEALAMSYVERLQSIRGPVPSSNARPVPNSDEEMWVDER